MTPIYITPFTYIDDGHSYAVEAEMYYSVPVTSEKHLASCPDDLVYTFEVNECRVYNTLGEDVSDKVTVPDEVILRELEISQEFDDYREGIDYEEGMIYESY